MLLDNIKSASILIVDDEPANVLLLQRFLENDNYMNVHAETDPRNVAALHKSNHYDLILLDINMPHLSGIEVLQQLVDVEQQRDSLPNVLILTAQTDNETRLRALQAGARDFVNKPFNHIEVLQRINNLLEVSLLHKEAKQQNIILEEKVRKRTMQLEVKNQELSTTRLEIIRRLGRAVEYRDNETGFHILRMSNYCKLLAEKIGMSDDKVELLLNASPMHDIGKIGISDKILLKPGKLDEMEWLDMQKHVLIGVEILSGHQSELMEMAKTVALTHHEKWDGSGYPYGLAGESIPLVGRIVALADVFDALTSERPYKQPWSLDEAVFEIESLSGTHFDPELVELFKENLSEFLEIKDQYAEPDSKD